MKPAILAMALQVSVLSLFAATPPKECILCVGVAGLPAAAPAAPVPMLLSIANSDLAATGTALDALSPDERKKSVVVVTWPVEQGRDPLQQVEEQTKTLVDWARAHGPFDALGIDVPNTDAATRGYAIKRLAVTAQGQNVASKIVLAPTSVDAMKPLYDTGAQAYFDVVIANADVAAMAKWLAENDPVKKVYAVVQPQSPNPFFDLARALADGATRAYLVGAADAPELASIASLDNALAGDYAWDSTSKVDVLDAKGNRIDMPVLTFVRGEDLRTIVVPRGDPAAPIIMSLSTDAYVHPRRVDELGERDITDVGKKGGHYLVGVMPSKQPYAITVEHAEKPSVQKEAISVATQRGITVEEIIRNHQAYKSYQESITPRYIAKDTTKLRFAIGDGGEAIEATIAGPYFFEPHGVADWVWQDFFVNGVKWKYGRIPELPLIQPEKVTQLPLDIHLTNEYRYELVREVDVDGYHTYEVRFQPPPNAPASLPLYRGTVWIDSKSWARIRITMVQLHLTGEVLSNEERVDFQPFARATNAPLAVADVAKTDPREVLWLPREVSAQQVISAAGRANVVLRATSFTDFRINPSDFDAAHQEASASNSRMIRETDAGMKYLEKNPQGERVVKEGFDSARTFMLGGIHHDSGLDYPVVPLGGIDYFNFDLAHRGIQTNVFFAGVIVAANMTNPNVADTRTNLGADFFGIAIPFTNSMYRNFVEDKPEAVKTLPINLSLRAGHPFWQFGKIDVSLGLGHISYQRSSDTAPDFIVPSSTFLIAPGVNAQYSRWGYTLAGFYDYNRRTSWKPWGVLSEYNPDQKSFTHYGGSFGKSFYLPKFQRIGVEFDYVDGQRLDRFSKYELGFFGSQRIHGVRSGSVRAERAYIGHLSYGLVFSDQFRLETFYDHGLIDDRTAGYHHEPFQGVGLGGTTVGPWGTLLRLDLGKSVGRNAQSGFVANVVVLKLF